MEFFLITSKFYKRIISVKIINILGDPSGPRAVSLIAIHQHGIPNQFPQEVLEESEKPDFFESLPREDFKYFTIVRSL